MHHKRSAWKGIVAGAVGGLAATYVMTKFQTSFSKLAQEDQENQAQGAGGEPSTVKMADKIATTVTGHHLPKQQKEAAGNLVHFGFGTIMGIAYGVLTEAIPAANAGFGTAFGSVLFVGADEVGVPAAGLSKPPQETPLKLHAFAWASHLVYGAALEASRLATRAALSLVGNDDRRSGFDRRRQRPSKRDHLKCAA